MATIDAGSADKDLDVVWKEALKEFGNITGGTITLDPKTSFDAITERINVNLKKSKTKYATKSKEILDKAMQCLQIFGGVVAQATSVVFGPSTQCWNAISFMITAAQSYQEILDGFMALLERSMAFLERLNTFLREKKSGAYLDPHLRKPAYEILGLFLQVTGECWNMTHRKRDKFKLFLGVVLFNSDGGMSGRMAEMEQKVRDVTDRQVDLINRQVDVILQDVKGLAKHLGDSEDERKQHEGELREYMESISDTVDKIDNTTQQIMLNQEKQISFQQHEAHLKTIRTKLGLEDAEPWAVHQGYFSKRRAEETGMWLLGNREFRGWAHSVNCPISSILIAGERGFGKSFIYSSVVSHLVKTSLETASKDNKITVLYYYVEDTGDSMLKCMSSLVYQRAKTEIDYAQAIAAICEQTGEFTDAGQVWTELIIRPLVIGSSTTYICIDGCREVEKQNDGSANELLTKMILDATPSDESTGRLRLFLTLLPTDLPKRTETGWSMRSVVLGADSQRGRDSSAGTALPGTETEQKVDDLLRSDKISPLLKSSAGRFNRPQARPRPLPRATPGFKSKKSGGGLLEMPPDGRSINEQDVINVAESRLKALCREKPDLKSLVDGIGFDKFVKSLAGSSQGNYQKLNSELRQVDLCVSEEQLRAVIARGSQSVVDNVKAAVKSVNAMLPREDVKRLNHILLWVFTGFGSRTAELLQSALFFSLQEKLMIRSLVDQKLSALLYYHTDRYDGDRGNLRPVADELRDILQASTEREKSLDAAQESGEILHASEIELTRRFLKTMCGDDLFRKFAFDEFFDGKVAGRIAQIRLENDNRRQIAMLEICVGAISVDQQATDTKLDALIQYAGEYWHHHLSNIQNMLDADREQLRKIGAAVCRMLTDAVSIKRWWKLDLQRLDALDKGWIQGEKLHGLLIRLLRNPYVAEGFQTSQYKTWIEFAISDQDRHTILHNVAVEVVEPWCSGSSGSIGYNFYIPYQIMTNHLRLKPVVRETWAIGLDDLVTFIEWVKSKLTSTEINWKYAEGRTYRRCGHYDKAYEVLKEAELHLSSHWQTLNEMAQTLVDKEEFSQALDYIRRLCKLQESDQSLRENKDYITKVGEIRQTEAYCHEQLEDFASAQDCYDTLARYAGFPDTDYYTFVRAGALRRLFRNLDDQEKYEVIMSTVEKYRDPVKETNLNLIPWLRRLSWRQWGYEELVHLHIIHAGFQTGRIDKLVEMYDDISQDMQADAEGRDVIRYFYAAALYYGHRSADNERDAFEIWKGLATRKNSEALFWVPRKAYKSIYRLLSDSIAPGQTPNMDLVTAAEAYINGLAQPGSSQRHDFMTGSNDPRIAQARLLHRRGQGSGAKEILRSYFADILDNLPNAINEAAVDSHFWDIAAGLMIIDEDEAARAAWHTLGRKPLSKANAEDGNRIGSEAARVSISARCDGCGDKQKIEDLKHWCKDCLGICLCDPCYEKREQGTLNILVCSPSHTHLYVPPIDDDLWQRLKPGEMVSENGIVTREAWLDEFRVKWNLAPEQIEVKKTTELTELRAGLVLVRYLTRLLAQSRRQREDKGYKGSGV